MSAVRLSNRIEDELRRNGFAWDADTVFLASAQPLVASHIAKNGRPCAMVNGRYVYTERREDSGYDAVGGINLPAVLIPVSLPQASAAG